MKIEKEFLSYKKKRTAIRSKIDKLTKELSDYEREWSSRPLFIFTKCLRHKIDEDLLAKLLNINTNALLKLSFIRVHSFENGHNGDEVITGVSIENTNLFRLYLFDNKELNYLLPYLDYVLTTKEYV